MIEQFAVSQSMSVADSEFILGRGSKVLVDFASNSEADPRFGAVWVEYKPFSIHVRTTKPAPDLSDRLSTELGRKAIAAVGGMSRSELRQQEARVSELFDSARRKSGKTLRAESQPDSRSGTLRILVNPQDRRLIEQEGVPAGVDVREGEVDELKPASYAGAGMSDCTVGYAATRPTGSGPERAVVTAGHCPNTGQTAYGYSLGAAQFQICSNADRQLHTTSSPRLWYGFYDYNNYWTTIAGVAGGWYNGQPFFRRGRFTQAIGTIGDPKLVALGGNPISQDCGDRYNAYAFPLFNGGGNPVVGGDSGGPLMLAYFGGWYLAGITTAAGSPNNGQPTSGWSAVRDIPAGWTPCTALNPCN
jgi:hypothetical protein